ncbi:endonuclease/exonuclease/phosphatase family protein [Tundrisphaera sp. TA3]|uniref:endonuclease/exonuclease/phosphatase family protein n=1 Tax=Tundrisphaera sp. TA3 TaxID=3435775 RepID=UPI003EBE2C03
MKSERAAILAVGLMLLAAPAPAAEPIRLATFNIHHAEGKDGVLDLDRVAGVVRGADIVAFQEVDVRFGERSKFEDQAERLGKALGGNVTFGGNLIVGDGRYGVALVSRFPIVSSRNHPLPRSAGREQAEPRGLLESLLDVNGVKLRVFVTHLAHDSKEDRQLQIDAVRSIVAAEPGPAILMGDLNLRPESPDYARLIAPAPGKTNPVFVDAWARAGEGPGATLGLGGKNPGRIDYILATPDIGEGFAKARVDTTARASDHQPVFVELTLPATPK